MSEKKFLTGIDLNGNTLNNIGNTGASATAGSIKYDAGTLYYHNGTEWVALGEGMKYMGELADATLPQGAEDGEVYRVMSDTYDQVPMAYSAGTWRSFTSAEIKYIVHQRANEGSLKCFCVIDGQYKGLMLLPDDFANETSITFNWNAESAGGHYSDNQFTMQQFKQLESEGAVLFPCTVFPNRSWAETRCVGTHIYWTGSRLGQAYVSASFTWYDSSNDPTYDTTDSGDFLRCDDNWQSLNPFAVRLIQVVSDSEKAFGITLGGNSYYVKFAPANLQYNCQAHKFRFAKNQYDACTLEQNGRPEWVAQANVTLTGNRWVDAMGYGSSGYNANWTPASRTNNQYTAPTDNLLNTNWDWGTYNQIGGWTEGVYPAGSAFVVDNGELVPLCAGVPLDIYEQLPNIADKADKVSGATSGNFAGLDATGNLTDSGVSPADISGSSNYTIYAPMSVMASETPILLGTEFSDITDAIEQGKNPILVVTAQDSTEQVNYVKINDYLRTSLATIPDGQGGTITPTDAITFYTTLNFIGTTTDLLVIFVNPADNETYIYFKAVSLPIILWDNNSAIYQAWGDNSEKAIDVKIDGVTIKKQNDGTLYADVDGNYPIYVPETSLLPNVPALLSTSFTDICGAIADGKNPMVILTTRVGGETVNVGKIDDYAIGSPGNIPDGHGGTINPTDAITFHMTIYREGTNTIDTNLFVIFVNPNDNNTYICLMEWSRIIPDDTFVIDATGGNQTDQYPNAQTFEQIINAYNSGKRLALKTDYSTQGFGFGITSTILLTEYEYRETEVELTPPPDYTFRLDKNITFSTDKENPYFPYFTSNLHITIGQGDAIQGTNEHKIAVVATQMLMARDFKLVTPENATNGNVAINRYEYNSNTQDYDSLTESIGIEGAGGTTVTTDANGKIIVTSQAAAEEVYIQNVTGGETSAQAEAIYNNFVTAYNAGKVCIASHSQHQMTTTYELFYLDSYSTQNNSGILHFTNDVSYVNVEKIYNSHYLPPTSYSVTIGTIQQTVYEESTSTNDDFPVVVSTHANDNGTSHFASGVTINPSSGLLIANDIEAGTLTATDGIMVLPQSSDKVVQIEPDSISIYRDFGTTAQDRIRMDIDGVWFNDTCITPQLIEGNGIILTPSADTTSITIDADTSLIYTVYFDESGFGNPEYTPVALGMNFDDIIAEYENGKSIALEIFSENPSAHTKTADYRYDCELKNGQTVGDYTIPIYTNSYSYSNTQVSGYIKFTRTEAKAYVSSPSISYILQTEIYIYKDPSDNNATKIFRHTTEVTSRTSLSNSAISRSGNTQVEYFDVKIDNSTIRKTNNGTLYAVVNDHPIAYLVLTFQSAIGVISSDGTNMIEIQFNGTTVPTSYDSTNGWNVEYHKVMNEIFRVVYEGSLLHIKLRFANDQAKEAIYYSQMASYDISDESTILSGTTFTRLNILYYEGSIQNKIAFDFTYMQ